MTRTVQHLEADTRRTFAEFELDGEQLVARYFDDSWRHEFEINGIYSVATGEVWPEDGRAFFDALPVAFGASSRIAVVDS